MSDSRKIEPLPIDDMFEALRARTRRQLLVDLLQTYGDEAAKPVDDLDLGGDVEDADTRLYHVDLPKLDGVGVVEWDRQSGTVAAGPQFEEVRPLVELVDRHDEEFSEC